MWFVPKFKPHYSLCVLDNLGYYSHYGQGGNCLTAAGTVFNKYQSIHNFHTGLGWGGKQITIRNVITIIWELGTFSFKACYECQWAYWPYYSNLDHCVTWSNHQNIKVFTRVIVMGWGKTIRNVINLRWELGTLWGEESSSAIGENHSEPS